jgi:uridine phosphorylase
MKAVEREKLKPCGIHTAVGHINELRRAHEIPYLRENNGKLPPFIIAVGSRVRVEKAKDILNLKEAVLVDEIAKEKIGLEAYGRTRVMVGIFEGMRITLPIVIAETQMGCPATQIIVRELLYYASEKGYVVDGIPIKSDGIYIIRAGTAAGVNNDLHSSDLALSIGDVVIASENYGSIGAVIQSYLSILHFGSADMGKKVEELKAFLEAERGIILSEDHLTLKTRCSRNVVHTLKLVSEILGLEAVVGANFTKDSLYAEADEKSFVELRKRYGVMSTEMEAFMIDAVAHEFNKCGVHVESGLVSAIVGVIPGKSFAESDEEKQKAKKAEENALLIAAYALEMIADSVSLYLSHYQ